VRQISIVSEEELAAIAKTVGVDHLDPASFGEKRNSTSWSGLDTNRDTSTVSPMRLLPNLNRC
jgi:hypothetical protein